MGTFGTFRYLSYLLDPKGHLEPECKLFRLLKQTVRANIEQIITTIPTIPTKAAAETLIHLKVNVIDSQSDSH